MNGLYWVCSRCGITRSADPVVSDGLPYPPPAWLLIDSRHWGVNGHLCSECARPVREWVIAYLEEKPTHV